MVFVSGCCSKGKYVRRTLVSCKPSGKSCICLSSPVSQFYFLGCDAAVQSTKLIKGPLLPHNCFKTSVLWWGQGDVRQGHCGIVLVRGLTLLFSSKATIFDLTLHLYRLICSRRALYSLHGLILSVQWTCDEMNKPSTYSARSPRT
jgi:hypothetical protein